MLNKPPLTLLTWQKQYRIIPSEFPPINFFENLVDPELMQALFYIESLTNDRLRHETGDISLIAKEDRISGVGSTPVMAAFTHVSQKCPSRFSDGRFGVYYAANSLQTAIEETRYHREVFLAYTNELAGQIDMRVFIGDVIKPMFDVRADEYADLHLADSWQASQMMGAELRELNAWGIVYHSVRHSGGYCIAAFRPPAVSIPRQGPHLSYIWDGKKIIDVFEKKRLEFN